MHFPGSYVPFSNAIVGIDSFLLISQHASGKSSDSKRSFFLCFELFFRLIKLQLLYWK